MKLKSLNTVEKHFRAYILRYVVEKDLDIKTIIIVLANLLNSYKKMIKYNQKKIMAVSPTQCPQSAHHIPT